MWLEGNISMAFLALKADVLSRNVSHVRGTCAKKHAQPMIKFPWWLSFVQTKEVVKNATTIKGGWLLASPHDKLTWHPYLSCFSRLTRSLHSCQGECLRRLVRRAKPDSRVAEALLICSLVLGCLDDLGRLEGVCRLFLAHILGLKDRGDLRNKNKKEKESIWWDWYSIMIYVMTTAHNVWMV